MLGLNEKWLSKTLKGISEKNVFLLTVDNKNSVYMLLKETAK